MNNGDIFLLTIYSIIFKIYITREWLVFCPLGDNKLCRCFSMFSCFNTWSNSLTSKRFLSFFETDRWMSFSSSMWMINRVHIFPKNMWFFPKSSLSSGFSNNNILMLIISHFSNSSKTIFIKFSYFSRRQLDKYNLE